MPSACPRLRRPQYRAARAAGGIGRAGAGLVPAMVDEFGATSVGAVHVSLVSRPKHRSECLPGTQYLDHPDRGCDRTSTRRLDFHHLYEDRLGDIAVLSDPAGAGCDPVAAAAENRGVSYCRDL